MDILVRLTGDTIKLKILSLEFTEPDFNVVEIGSTYYIESTQFKGLNNDEIYNLANENLERINLLFKYHTGYKDNFGIDCIMKINDDGGKSYYKLLEGKIIGISQITVTGQIVDAEDKSKSCSTLEDYYRKMKKFIEVEKVIRLFGNPTWANLYVINEVICYDMGEKLFTLRWTTRTENRRFKQTANLHRHHKVKENPPEKPMSIKEAQNYIKGISTRWINWKS